MKYIALALTLLVLACAPHTLYPASTYNVGPPVAANATGRTVILDDSLTPFERTEATLGVVAWRQALPHLRLSVISQSEAFIWGTPPYAIHVIALPHVNGADCLLDPDEHVTVVGCYRAPDRIELGMLDAPAGHWDAIVAHELGHAFGLSHDDEGTLMSPHAPMPAKPTKRDIAQYCKVNWCP